ncbi:MAG: hypothetical protein KBC57_09655 [Neisseriaceae bacterium]|nr:hypothetical protein [Neisseriaceae bacterium]
MPWPCAFTPNTQNKAHLTVGFVASGGRRVGLSVAGGVVGRLRFTHGLGAGLLVALP